MNGDPTWCVRRLFHSTVSIYSGQHAMENVTEGHPTDVLSDGWLSSARPSSAKTPIVTRPGHVRQTTFKTTRSRSFSDGRLRSPLTSLKSPYRALATPASPTDVRPGSSALHKRGHADSLIHHPRISFNVSILFPCLRICAVFVFV